MRDTREMQPQYRRPLRPGIDPAAKRTAQQQQQRKGMLFGRIPRSVAINFGALLVLACIVLALQTVGERFRTKSTTEQPAAKSISVAAMPALPSAETATDEASAKSADLSAPAPVAAEAKQAARPAVAAAAAAPAPSVYNLPQKQAAATADNNDEEVTPRIDAKKTATAKKQARIAQQNRDALAEDRNFSVEELDNEGARRHYLSANRGTAYEPAPAPQVKPMPRYEQPAPRYEQPAPVANRRSVPAVYDLDGESARQNYLAENRRTSGGGITERTEKKSTRPMPAQSRPSENDYIPYEQGK